MLALLALASPAAAQTLDCPGATSQLEMSDCAARAAQGADAELNRLWKLVKPQADARGDGQKLLDAQRTWLSYRDQTCELEAGLYEGGTIAPMIYSICIQEATLARNERLRALLIQ